MLDSLPFLIGSGYDMLGWRTLNRHFDKKSFSRVWTKSKVTLKGKSKEAKQVNADKNGKYGSEKQQKCIKTTVVISTAHSFCAHALLSVTLSFNFSL